MYKPGSTLHNFGDRTRTGVFKVMAVDNKSSIFNIYKEYILKTASTGSGKCFNEFGQFFIFCARPQIIIHDIHVWYILHPSIEHFHTIPFSLFSFLAIVISLCPSSVVRRPCVVNFLL